MHISCAECECNYDVEKIEKLFEEQLAEWLEELKFYKEKDQKFIHLTVQEFDDVYNKGRADAIEEFKTDIINKIDFEEKWLMDWNCDNVGTNTSFSVLRTFVEIKAEQLKENNNEIN